MHGLGLQSELASTIIPSSGMGEIGLLFPSPDCETITGIPTNYSNGKLNRFSVFDSLLHGSVPFMKYGQILNDYQASEKFDTFEDFALAMHSNKAVLESTKNLYLMANGEKLFLKLSN